MKNRILLFLLLLVSVSCGALIGAPSANAASPYDNVITTVDSLIFKNSTCTSSININAPKDRNWSDEYVTGWQSMDDSDYQYNIQLTDEAWNAVQGMEKIYTTVVKGGSDSNSNLQFFYTNDPNARGHFYMNSGVPQFALEINAGYSIGYFTLEQNNSDCNRYWINGGFYTAGGTVNWDIATDEFNGQQNKLFVFQAPVDYPDGYSGELIPNTIPTEDKLYDYWLNFTYTNTTNQLIANYTNFNTNPISSLPQPKYVWWTLYKDAPNVTDGENVCEATTLRSVPFNMNSECPDLIIDNQSQYFLRAGVNPLDNPDLTRPNTVITFKFSVFVIDFSTPSQGTTEDCVPGATGPSFGVFCAEPQTIDFTQCFTNEFPFVDPFECADNFRLIFNLLATGSITLPRWNFDPSCTSLNTFDDWLNLPQGYQVCPQFPPSVRNVVTPFVAFMLGIVTLGFISRHNRAVGGNN